jgi:hypothetical protein
MQTWQYKFRNYTFYSLQGTVELPGSLHKVLRDLYIHSAHEQGELQIIRLKQTANQLILVRTAEKAVPVNLNGLRIHFQANDPITVVWCIHDNDQRGPVIALQNHRTGVTVFRKAEVRKLLHGFQFAWLMLPLFVAVILVIAGITNQDAALLAGLPATCVTYFIVHQCWNSRAEKLMKGFPFPAYENEKSREK